MQEVYFVPHPSSPGLYPRERAWHPCGHEHVSRSSAAKVRRAIGRPEKTCSIVALSITRLVDLVVAISHSPPSL